MGFGITKTIPQKEGKQAIKSLYNGELTEYEFHMAGKPSKLNIGDYVYTIFNDQLIGRLKIIDFVFDQINPKSGTARTLIIVSCPGEKFSKPIPKKGHRGTRYTDGQEWSN
jgi:hypothetical protein